MRRKLWVGLGAALLALGIGTAVYAADGTQGLSFQDMLPFMKQMHPNFSDQQLEQMYRSCHQNGAAGTMMQSGPMMFQ